MARKKRYYHLLGQYGTPQQKKYTFDEYAIIPHYYENTVDPVKTQVIDDITWNDLNLDEIFLMINHTYSSVGRDYLYKLLRTPSEDAAEMKERERLIRYFAEHPEERTNCELAFDEIGFSRKISISDHMDRLFKLKRASNLFHILLDFLIVFSILFTIFVNPTIGIAMILVSLGVSIVTYYKTKSAIDSFFTCIYHLVNMLQAGKKISSYHIPELQQYCDKLDDANKEFANVKRGAWLLTSRRQQSGSIGDVLFEYFRMFTHIDLMKFNSMLGNIGGHKEKVFELMDTLGYIESMISIASYRELLPYYCIPEFTEDNSRSITAKELYHVSIERPVANSICVDGPVLITGSNASGKSTFLKSVAIAAVLAQTIHTVPAELYKAPFFRIYSSMALADNLESGQSYYIVEINSLKRVVDSTRRPGSCVLCFIDEVLRGTNTIERIAASSQILRDLAANGAMCFAATHDIELTDILKDIYHNYHFTEEFIDDKITFNYLLREGKATSRNAIRLLGVMGYDEAIIRESQKMADYFMAEGKWGCL